MVRRGSLTRWVDQDTLQAGRSQRPNQHGAQFEESDPAIQCRLTLRAVSHLTLRATAGFARSLFDLRHRDRPVSDSTTLCRRAATGPLTRPKKATGPLHRVRDSTGLKADGVAEGKVGQPGPSQRRPGRKLPRAVAPQTHEIQAAVVSEPGGTDAAAVASLREPVDNPVAGGGADGASDRRAVSEALDRRRARAVIPPRRDAKIQRHGPTSGPRLARDEDRRRIRKMGREAWPEESGSHQRSWAETAVVRMKTIFGDGVSSRRLAPQATEAGIRCRAWNIRTHEGMLQSERVAA